MCGISGFWGSVRNNPYEILGTLNRAQVHRGPDGDGIWLSSDRQVGFAHRRLSIVDLNATGRQPMISASGRYVITFNGEVYNFLRLRHELTQLGHKFRGTSDTEVMLAAFEQWGVVESLSRLNGMFAAGVWDQRERVGYLFRDRLGVKPLYYQWNEGVLFFSSELTAPFAHLGPRSISRNALALFFRHGYIPAPYSIYEGIFKLVPGTVLQVTASDSETALSTEAFTYWDNRERINEILNSQRCESSEEGFCEQLDAAVRRSVRDRMIADVPLGAFLSGGIDSSLIVSYMQQVSNSRVRTFTIGFEEDAFNEAGHARKVAEHLETSHTELIVTEQDALDVVPLLPAMYGEPFADSSQIPTYLVSKLTREHVTVALSGDGGDELFVGYNRYARIGKYLDVLTKIPKPLAAIASKMLAHSQAPNMLAGLAGARGVLRALDGTRTLQVEFPTDVDDSRWGPMTMAERLVRGARPGISVPPKQACAGNAIERAMCHDVLTYLPDDILVKVDRASMAVSLEVRAPFADDFEIFDIAWKMPFAFKMNGSGGKLVLRKLLAKFVPPELTERRKTGFAVPLTKWISGALRNWANDCVSLARISKEGYLRPKEVAYIHRQALGGNAHYAQILWYICQFQTWLSNSRANTASVYSPVLCR